MDVLQAYEMDEQPEDIGAGVNYRTEEDRMQDRIDEMRAGSEGDLNALAGLGDPNVKAIAGKMRQSFDAMNRITDTFAANVATINREPAFDSDAKSRAIEAQREQATRRLEKLQQEATGALTVLELELKAGAAVEHGLSGADFGNRLQILSMRLGASSGQDRFTAALRLAREPAFAEVLGGSDGRLILGLADHEMAAVEDAARGTLAQSGSPAQQKAAGRMAAIDNAKRAYAQLNGAARARAFKAKLI